MPEMKLGTKHECFNCGTKFYDLGKSEALCPKCGADQKDAVQSDTLAASQASRRRRKADVAKPIDVEDEESIGGEDFGDEEMVAPDLGDDEEVSDEEDEDLDDDEA